jgi:hypothetical protein
LGTKDQVEETVESVLMVEALLWSDVDIGGHVIFSTAVGDPSPVCSGTVDIEDRATAALVSAAARDP